MTSKTIGKGMIENVNRPTNPPEPQPRPPDHIQIFLTEGKQINCIDDINSIYTSFVLPSWFPEYHKTRIVEMVPIGGSSYFSYKTVLRSQSVDVVMEISELGKTVRTRDRKDVSKGPAGSSITWAEIAYNVKIEVREYRLKVTFQSRLEWQFIVIKVEDPQGFFSKELPVGKSDNRIPAHWQIKKDHDHDPLAIKKVQLYYPYIEPENIRSKVQDHQHYHLAFQGGGAKGAAYLGAVQALRQEMKLKDKNMKITSIIGSSAGGIIALALAADCSLEELKNHCNLMTTIPTDTTVTHKREGEERRDIPAIKQDLLSAIRDFGLVPQNSLYIIDRIFADEQFVDALLELVGTAMDGIGDMFQFSAESNSSNVDRSGARLIRGEGGLQNALINRKADPQKKLNYYGLLIGHLLKGQAVKTIALGVIKEFLKKISTTGRSYLQELKKICPLMREPSSDGELEEYAIVLTMKQFYQLTQVEFTVTSVDIDSQLLRFFNHKTTPDLPVHMSVIMTGSFPVAFEALKWQPQWGKYYIHYDRWRREIDITGHQFTDGGMLANFPMMYLDNESMRPMYFSHKCNYTDINKATQIIGFGLEEIAEKLSEAQQKKKKQRSAELIAKLKDRAMANLPCAWLLRIPLAYMCAGQRTMDEAFDLNRIPLFRFLYRLLRTYIAAGGNLVEECFEKDICAQIPDSSIVDKLKIGSHQIVMTEPEREAIINAKFCFEDEAELRNMVRSHLEKCEGRNGRNAHELTRIIVFVSHVVKIIESLCEKQKDELQFPEDNRPVSANDTRQIGNLSARIQQLRQGIISLEQIKIYEPLVEVMQPEDTFTQLKVIWSRLMQGTPLRRINPRPDKLRIEDLIGCWPKSLVNDPNYDQEIANLDPSYNGNHLHKIRRDIIELGRKYKIYDVISRLQFKEREEKIRYYINSRLNSTDSLNIHIVFKGSGEHSLFSYQIFRTIEDCLFQHKYDKFTPESKIAEHIIETYFTQQVNPQNNSRRRYTLRIELEQLLIMNLPKIIKERSFELPGHREKETVIGNDQEGELIYKFLLKLQEIKKTSSEPSANGAEWRLECPRGHPMQWYANATLDEVRKKLDRKITSVTCGSMHSFLGFLLTTGRSPPQIENDLNSMSKIFQLDSAKVLAEFNRKDWAVSDKLKITKAFQEEMWQCRYDLFANLEAELDSLGERNRPDMFSRLQNIKSKFEASKQDIMNGFEAVLDHLLASQNSSRQNKDPMKYLSEEMGVRFGSVDYLSTNKKMCDDTKHLVSLLLEYFEEQVCFVLGLTASEAEKQLMLMDRGQLGPGVWQQLWKFMIITKFLTCSKLKEYVQGILHRMGLSKNITLKEYMSMAPRKLQLTFPVVDITNKKMRFINSKTFPYMPVWAAVAVGSSIPMLFPLFKLSRHWVDDFNPKSDIRKAKSFFDQEVFTRPLHFISGDLISSFPLDLLTNRKVRQTYFEHDNYAMLNFGVESTDIFKDIPRNYSRKYLKPCQMLSLKKAFGGDIDWENLKNSTRANILQTFVESHDNLVIDLYSKESLRLPVRFSTLSFYKFELDQGSDISSTMQRMVNETYYSAKQKFITTNLTYILAKVVPGKKPALNKLVVDFISKQRGNRDWQSNYKIKYKIGAMEYSQLQGTIEILRGENEPTEEQELFLQFEYLHKEGEGQSTLTIKQSTYALSLRSLFGLVEPAIFPFDYKVVRKQELKEQKPPTAIFNRNGRNYNSRVNYRSVITLSKTGLYCEYCCKQLQKQANKTGAPRGRCTCCHKIKGMLYRCHDWRQVGEGLKHSRCCLGCCKGQIRGGIMLCAKKHPYVMQDLTDMISRPVVNCDNCLQDVLKYYMDFKCNISICLKCFTEMNKETQW